MQYADFLDFQRRWEDVEKIYREILARKDLPSAVRGAILNNLSFLLAMQGRNQDEAAKFIDEAVDLFGPQSDVLDTRGVVNLSKGDTQKLLEFIHCAQRDYRDVLYWAEYFDSDPMLKNRDPKKLVEDLLAKWGTKAG